MSLLEHNQMVQYGSKMSAPDYTPTYLNSSVQNTTPVLIHNNNTSLRFYLVDIILSTSSINVGGSSYFLYVTNQADGIIYYIVNNCYINIDTAFPIFVNFTTPYVLSAGNKLYHKMSNALKLVTVTGRGVTE